MGKLVAASISLLITNFTLTLFVVGLIFSGAAILRYGQAVNATVVTEKLLSWYLFWTIGVSFLVNFVFHAFFGRMSAAFIGWADSPFQFEVATASLGFSVVGFLAAWRSFDLRLAAIVGPAMFLLGAAGGHIYQMIIARNLAPGNAGVIFYTDIGLPLFGFVLLWLQARQRMHRSGSWHSDGTAMPAAARGRNWS
jgi:hypothetical protein